MARLRTVYARRASTILHHLAAAGSDGTYILPANLCHSVPLALARAHRTCHFVDVRPGSLDLDPELALDLLRRDPDRYVGIIYVRTYGSLSQDVEAFFSEARGIRSDLLIVDDRCLCVPSFELPTLDRSHADPVQHRLLEVRGSGRGRVRLSSGWNTI